MTLTHVATKQTATGKISVSELNGEMFVHDFECVDPSESVSLFLWARKICKGRMTVVTVAMENTKMKQVIASAGLKAEQVMFRGVA